ncbi:hypothetical protein ACRYI5_06400 [Furfurilactobacillus sp. WILCCON 0119]
MSAQATRPSQAEQVTTAAPQSRDASLTVDSRHGRAQTRASFHAGITLHRPHLDANAAKSQRHELNLTARASLRHTMHAHEGLIVHTPDITDASMKTAHALLADNQQIMTQLVRQMQGILQHQRATTVAHGKPFGQTFDATRTVNQDFRYFTKKRPPNEAPTLAIAVRLDQSASMVDDDRIAHEQAAIFTLTAFCRALDIPLAISGDTADISAREATSIYTYKTFADDYDTALLRLADLKAFNNNRDGSALRILLDQLADRPEQTKLLLNLSDGQPRALPNYTGALAKADLQDVVKLATSRGCTLLSAALGDDAATLKEIYGADHFLDFTDLHKLPTNLVHTVMRFI